MCDRPLQQLKWNRAVRPRVLALAGVVAFHPAMALGDLQELRRPPQPDKVAGQRNQPADNPSVVCLSFTENRLFAVADQAPESDDVAAEPVEATAVHQQEVTWHGVEGGEHDWAAACEGEACGTYGEVDAEHAGANGLHQ